jgi:predicted RNA-binding protein YlqC (UPF0109 family)
MLKGLLGDAKYDIVESTEESLEGMESGRLLYTIKTEPENIGLIIGKGGKMIKALRNVLKVRATLEKKAVSVNVE